MGLLLRTFLSGLAGCAVALAIAAAVEGDTVGSWFGAIVGFIAGKFVFAMLGPGDQEVHVRGRRRTDGATAAADEMRHEGGVMEPHPVALFLRRGAVVTGAGAAGSIGLAFLAGSAGLGMFGAWLMPIAALSYIASELLPSRPRRPTAQAGVGGTLHPDLPPLDRDRETRGLLLVGGTGSGKTVILSHLITSVHGRHRAIVHDAKGDYSARLPGALGRDLILLAPWDSRSHIWDAAADIQSRADAQTYADILISDSSDPMWSTAARQVLSSILTECATAQPGSWTWSDVLGHIARGPDHLSELIARHAPEATATAAGLKSKTGQSIMISMSTYLSPLHDLARAWPARIEGRMWSIRHFLADDYSGPQTIILQGSGRYAGLLRAVAGALVGLGVSAIAGPSYSESRSRRIYWFLDELPQLGKIPQIIQMIEVGRSKGMCPILAMQDIAQMDRIYSREDRQTIMSGAGTHIYLRVGPGSTADALSEHAGRREIERLQISSSSGGSGGHDSRSESWQRQTEPVLLPSELSSLRASPSGVEGFLLGIGPDIIRLHWPILPMRDQRPTHQPATWLSGSGAGGGATPTTARREAEAEQDAPRIARGEMEAAAVAAPPAPSARTTGPEHGARTEVAGAIATLAPAGVGLAIAGVALAAQAHEVGQEATTALQAEPAPEYEEEGGLFFYDEQADCEAEGEAEGEAC